jgi:hypothetical protein
MLAIDKQKRGGDHKIDPSYGDQTINLYEQPERVAERVSLSMSLIDQDHTGTWGDGGIIVEVAEDNVIATGSQDLGAMNSDPAFLRKQFAASARYNGDDLLRMTYPETYNEVVALANVAGQKIKLKGFFYKTDSSGEPLDQTVASKMKMHAMRLGLPIVEVQKPNPYAQNKIEDKDDKLALHLGGNRYLLGGYDEANFYFYDEKMRRHIISSQQMQRIISFMHENGYGNNFTSALHADYERAHEKHFAAKLNFDEKGEIQSLKKIEGYGKNQTEYVITAAGYARIVDVEREIKALKESMLGKSKIFYGSCSDYYSPMSRAKAEELIAEVRLTISSDAQAKLAAWANKILPYLEHKSAQIYGRKPDKYGPSYTR